MESPTSGSGGIHGFLSPDSRPCRKDFWLADYYGKATEKLRVVTCKGPTNFWLQNMKQDKELKDLRVEMTDWYDEYWENARSMKADQVVVGGIYAAYWEKYQQWLRARVIGIVAGQEKGSEYTVQSLDYASVTTVPLDSIHPLREVYNNLPIQAVKAELYNETNPGTPFTQAQIQQFREFVTGKDLDVVVFGERDEPQFGGPIISVIIATEPFEGNENYKDIPPRVFTLEGALNYAKLFETLDRLHEQPS